MCCQDAMWTSIAMLIHMSSGSHDTSSSNFHNSSSKVPQCQHFYGHDVSGKAQCGYKADEACIALDEMSQTLR
eukprot:11301852-Karenia_brevis.AAC.1